MSNITFKCYRCSFSASSEERVLQHINTFHFVEHAEPQINNTNDGFGDKNIEAPERAEDSDSSMVTNVNKAESADRHSWTYEEAVCFINCMANHFDDLNHPRKRKYVFQNAANDRLSAGYEISEAACKSKWKNLLRSYKTAKDHQNKTGRGPARFLFYEQIDDLLGEKPSNSSNHSLESSNLIDIENSALEILEHEESEGTLEKGTTEQNVRKRKVSRKDDFLKLKKENYMKRDERHRKKVELSERKLALEERKIQLLENYLSST